MRATARGGRVGSCTLVTTVTAGCRRGSGRCSRGDSTTTSGTGRGAGSDSVRTHRCRIRGNERPVQGRTKSARFRSDEGRFRSDEDRFRSNKDRFRGRSEFLFGSSNECRLRRGNECRLCGRRLFDLAHLWFLRSRLRDSGSYETAGLITASTEAAGASASMETINSIQKSSPTRSALAVSGCGKEAE